jgi:hypothetical protein
MKVAQNYYPYIFIKPYKVKVLVAGGVTIGKEVYADYYYQIGDVVNGRDVGNGIETKGGIQLITIPYGYLEETHNMGKPKPEPKPQPAVQIQPEKSKSKIFTKQNIIIGGAIVVVLLGVFAYKKGWI